MKTIRELKIYHMITGRTQSGKFVTSGPWTSEQGCIAAFKTKYPRFKGQAELKKQEFECLINTGIVVYDPFSAQNTQVLKTFTQNKELY